MIMLTVTVAMASFDWLMSLDPHWYSTMFGVYVYSGAALAFIAALILILLAFRSADVLRYSVNHEHYHDLGKWLFALTVFWAYIAFSQYLLMWYANLPIEMEFYRRRSVHSWQWLTLSLLALQFILPFVILLSARAKRSAPTLALAALCVVAGHFLDWYWLVLPALYPEGAPLGVADAIMLVTTVLTMGAIMMSGLNRELSLVRPEPIWGTAAE